MIRDGLTGVSITVLVVLALVVGVAAVGLPVAGQEVQDRTNLDQHPPGSSAALLSDEVDSDLDEGEVGLELRPPDGGANPGGNTTYDVVITGPGNGVSAYSFNVTVGDLGVAEIDGFTLDRQADFDNSFITEDNATLVLDGGLGDQRYDPAEEVTIGTVDVAAVGSIDDSTTVDFEYDPNGSVLDNDEVLYTVAETQSATFTVEGPPAFEVSNLDPAEASVVEGETVNVSADVANVGGSGTQTVTLEIDGYSEETNVTLPSGENTTVTFEDVDTGALGPGEYEHAVSTTNDTVSGNLTVLAPAEFTVEVLGTSTPVEGEALNVTAQIANTGDVEATQTVELDVGALGGETTSVTLAGGESTEETLGVATGAGDAGGYEATVSSEDDSDSANVTVLAPASFAVDITAVDEEVTAGETLTVGYEVANTGGAEGTQNISFAVDGATEATETVTLGSNETVSDEFTYETGAEDAPGVNVTVASADDSDSANVTVLAPAVFTVDIVGTNAPLAAGEELVVTVAVENVGAGPGERLLQADAGPLGTDELAVDLGGGESTEVEVVFDSETEQTGTYDVTVDIEDDTDTVGVELHPSAVPGSDSPPQDPNGDGLYEDVDGDGAFDIFDVQAFFDNYKTETVTQHAPAFDFDGDESITIFDVQALFDQLSG